MPSTSKKQHNFMAICKHAPEKARGKCPPKRVAEEFLRADKRKRIAGMAP